MVDVQVSQVRIARYILHVNKYCMVTMFEWGAGLMCCVLDRTEGLASGAEARLRRREVRWG